MLTKNQYNELLGLATLALGRRQEGAMVYGIGGSFGMVGNV